MPIMPNSSYTDLLDSAEKYELLPAEDRYRLGLTRKEKEFFIKLKLTNEKAKIKQQRIAFRLHYLHRDGFWLSRNTIEQLDANIDPKYLHKSPRQMAISPASKPRDALRPLQTTLDLRPLEAIPYAAVKERKRVDAKKAIAAAKQAGLPVNYIEGLEEFSALKDVENLLDFASPKLHAVLTWFTSIRLFLIRMDRVIQHASHLAHGYLPGFTAFFALSYVPELLLHLTEIIAHLLRFETQAHEQDLINNKRYLKFFWERFKEIATEDGRMRAMSNAFVWSMISITGLVLTFTLGPLGALIAQDVILLAGFVFDVVPAVADGVLNLQPMWSAYKKMGDRIKQLDEYLAILNIHPDDLTPNSERAQDILAIFVAINPNCKFNFETENLETLRQKITDEKAALVEAHTQARKAATIATALSVWDVSVTIAVFTGMALLVTAGILATGALAVTPPGLAIVAGLGLAGALTAFIGGSCIGGLGKRLVTNMFTKIYDSATQQAAPTGERQPLLAPNNDPANSNAKIYRRLQVNLPQHSLSVPGYNPDSKASSNPSNASSPASTPTSTNYLSIGSPEDEDAVSHGTSPNQRLV